MSAHRSDARLLVAEGAVLTVTRAAELLGFREADEWLREQDLVSVAVFQGRRVERVVWRRVLARLEESNAPANAASTPPVPKKRYRLADV